MRRKQWIKFEGINIRKIEKKRNRGWGHENLKIEKQMKLER